MNRNVREAARLRVIDIGFFVVVVVLRIVVTAFCTTFRNDSFIQGLSLVRMDPHRQGTFHTH